MKRIFKKMISIMLVVIIFTGTMPFTGITNMFTVRAAAVSDDGGMCGDNVTYTFNSTTGELTISGIGDMYHYSSSDDIPWVSYRYEIKTVSIGNSVTSIGEYAFEYCTSLTNITIPNSVTSIGEYAFWDCTSLTSITIPNSVKSIGYRAFAYCTSLTSITVDSENQYYSSDSYGVLFNKDKTELIQYPIGNKRTSYTIPNSVISIGGYAFEDCTSLTSITIPNSVTSIGYGAFWGCTSLTSITVDSENQYYSSDSYGVLFNKDKTELIQYPIGNKRTSYTIPNSVTSIGYSAFEGCTGLTSYTIPNSVISIGGFAFAYCTSLTSITIPNSVISIGEYAFWGCTSLTTITIPNSVTSIGDGAFWGCTSLTSITIPNSVTSIGEDAFAYCTSLTSITIPNSVTSIGVSAFSSCYRLSNVYYSGTQDEWDDISIDDENYCLTDNHIHFGVTADDAETHYHVEIIEEPTCTSYGTSKTTCDCGYSYEQWIPALGHIKGEFVKTVEPTCINEGYNVYHCDRCDEDFITDYIDATGHNFADDICTHCHKHIDDCIESAHPYDNDADKTWTINKPGAEKIEITFSNETYTEDEFDYIYIYDSKDNIIGCYSGTSLSGITITVEADVVKIRLTSDGSVNYYGFSIENVKAYYPETLTPVNSSATVDNGRIYGLAGNLTKKDFENRYVNLCEERTVEYSTEKFGTGTVVTFKNTETGETIDSYEVVIFGDVDGDGVYDGNDAVVVDFLANGMLTKEQVGEAVYMAADCNHDGEINQTDVDILTQAGLLLAKVDQTKSEKELSTDSAYLEYQSLISQNPIEKTEQKQETKPLLETVFKYILQFIEIVKSFFAKLQPVK